jgi:hypothetical protein
MCLAMFVAFSATLAYYSRQPAKAAPRTKPAPAAQPETNGSVII